MSRKQASHRRQDPRAFDRLAQRAAKIVATLDQSHRLTEDQHRHLRTELRGIRRKQVRACGQAAL